MSPQEIIKNSRLDNPVFLKEIRDKILEEALQRVTDPRYVGKFTNPELTLDKIERGEKVSRGVNLFVLLEDLIYKVGQDFRLSLDEMDQLFKKIFI